MKVRGWLIIGDVSAAKGLSRERDFSFGKLIFGFPNAIDAYPGQWFVWKPDLTNPQTWLTLVCVELPVGE